MRSKTNIPNGKTVDSKKESAVFSELQDDKSEVFDNMEDIKEIVKRAQDIESADVKNKKGGTQSKTIVSYDEDNNNVQIAASVTDGKNIDQEIQNEIMRNMKVIIMGKPSMDDDLLRFLTYKGN